MAITILTPATARAFCTLAQVRLDLELPTAFTQDDAYLEELIEEAGSTIEAITGRVFCYEEIEETVPGEGHTQILLSRYPIDVSEDIVAVRRYQDGTEDEIDTSLLAVADEKIGLIESAIGFSSTHSFSDGINPRPITGGALRQWVITYWAGYLMADEADPDDVTLPKALTRIAREAVKTWYLGRGMASTVKSRRIADTGWTYSETDFHAMLVQRLQPWSRVV